MPLLCVRPPAWKPSDSDCELQNDDNVVLELKRPNWIGVVEELAAEIDA